MPFGSRMCDPISLRFLTASGSVLTVKPFSSGVHSSAKRLHYGTQTSVPMFSHDTVFSSAIFRFGVNEG